MRPRSIRVADRVPHTVHSYAHDVEFAQDTSGGNMHEWPRVIADGILDVTQERLRPQAGIGHNSVPEVLVPPQN